MSTSVTRYRWTAVVTFLFLISVINFGDRGVLGVAVPLLVREYHFTPKDLGWILSAFGFGYCAMQLFGSGAMVRLLQPRKLISGMAILWSIFLGFVAMATTVGGFFALRVLFGISEGTNWMSSETLLSRWFSRFEIQRANNIMWAGIPVSSIIVPPAAVLIAEKLTWRGPFVVLAAIGVLVGILFYRLIPDFPEDSKSVSQSERDFIVANRLVKARNHLPAYRWRTVLTSAPAWWAAIGSYATSFQIYMLLAWLPEYLVHYRHISYVKSGFLTALPFITAALGGIVMGTLSDRMHEAGKIYASRTAIPGLSAIVTGLAFILIYFGTSLPVALGLMMVSSFFGQATNGILGGTAMDIFPQEPHMGAQLIVGFGSLNAIVAPLVTGFIVSATHSFLDAFLLGGGLPLVCGFLLLVFFRPRATPTDAPIQTIRATA